MRSKGDAAVEDIGAGLPEILSKRVAKKYPVLFRCAKRSILPNKAETSQKRMRSFYGQNSTAQSHKTGYFSATLFPLVFEQSDRVISIAAVYSKSYKLVEKFEGEDRKDRDARNLNSIGLTLELIKKMLSFSCVIPS